MLINMKALISPMKLLRLHNRVFALRTPSKSAWTLTFSDDKHGKASLISLRMEKTRVPFLAILLPLALLLATAIMPLSKGK